MRLLVRRFITEQQRIDDEKPVTEDDINEVKQDISTFRYVTSVEYNKSRSL